MEKLDTNKSGRKFDKAMKNMYLVPISGQKDLVFLKDYFPENFFKEYELPQENIDKLVLQLENITDSLYGAIPVLCGGPKCPIRYTCPFDKQGMAPVGYPCPLEQIFLRKSIMEYVNTEKLNINNKDEMEKARELAECDLYIKFRTPAILAKDPTSFQEVAKRYHPESGQLIEEKTEISKALEVRMKMAKRRDQILDELVATRKGKLRHKLIQPGEDPSKAADRLLKKLQMADFEVIDDSENVQRDSEGKSKEHDPTDS